MELIEIKMAVVDTETRGFSIRNSDFKLGIINYLDKKTPKIFINDFDEFYDFVTTQLNRYKVYMHPYDFGVLFKNYIKFFSSGDNKILIGDKLYSCTKRNDGYKDPKGFKRFRYYTTFINILNLAPFSVKELGNILGLPKLETPDKFIDGSIFEITNEDIRYCMRDTEIIKLYLQKLVHILKDYKLRIRLTVPSISQKIMDKHYNHLFFDRDTKRYYGEYYVYGQRTYNDLFLKSYRGGICQNYIRGLFPEKIYKYDINSLYPFAMSKEFGVQYANRHHGLKQDEYRNLIKDYNYGLINCDIEVNYNYIPYIPYMNKKFCFPFGILKDTWINLCELKYNIDYNRIKLHDIHDMVLFEKTKHVFKEFVDDFYQLRKNSKKDKFADKFYKLVMNSLYGRYANQINNKQYIEKGELEDFLISIEKSKNLNLEDFIIDEIDDTFVSISYGPERKSLSKKAIVHLSSNVTSYSRLVMYDAFNKYKDDILYCDTDSIFTSKPIKLEDISKTKLGKFKFEGVYDLGYILNPKHYILRSEKEDIIKIKGIRGAKDTYFTDEFLFNMLGHDMPIKLKFNQDRLTTLKESFHLKHYNYMDLRHFDKDLNIFDNSKRVFNNDLDFNISYSESTPIKL